MSLLVRRLLILAAGAVAGALAWPLAELLQGVEMSFPSYLAFTVASGALYGLWFGLAFGALEGIAGGVSARKWIGLALGILFGLVAGAVGALAGQAIYLAIGQAVVASAGARENVLPLARGLGWAVMGALIGAAEGLRFRSARRAGIGALGGFIGGLAGGLLVEFGTAWSGQPWTRAAGSVVLGVLLASGFAIIERGFLLGTLVLVTGPLRGREYPLAPGRTTIGRSLSNTVSLAPYDRVAERHAVIIGNRRGLTLQRAADDAVIDVNEKATGQTGLKFDDVIDIGSARFFLKTP